MLGDSVYVAAFNLGADPSSAASYSLLPRTEKGLWKDMLVLESRIVIVGSDYLAVAGSKLQVYAAG